MSPVVRTIECMFDAVTEALDGRLDVDRLPYAEVVALLAECERQAAVRAALALRLMVRAAAAAAPELADFVADDVALACRISYESARGRIATAVRLAGPLRPVARLLAEGQVSLMHALAFAAETLGCPDEVSNAAALVLAGTLPDLSPGQVRTRVRRAIAELDPNGAAERMGRKLAERAMVTRDYGDGVGELAAVGSAAQVLAAQQAVRALAATYGDGRSVGQKESDAFFGLLTGWEPPAPEQLPAAPAPPPPPDPDCPMPEPPEDDGWEPPEGVPAPPAGLPLLPPPEAPPLEAPALPPARGRRAPGGPVRVVLRLQMDLPTLIGLAEHPAHLEGYGPVPAALGRLLAADAAWQRMIVEPLSGRLLDLHPRRYRPSAALADYVRTRDPHCMFTRCVRRRVQLDHNPAFDAGGQTTRDRLTPLCVHHHQGKTRRFLSYVRSPDGSYAWTTASGQSGHTPAPRPYD